MLQHCLEAVVTTLGQASPGPMLWPFLKASPRAPMIAAIRVFDNEKGRPSLSGPSIPLTTLYDNLRQFATCYDVLRCLATLCGI